MYSYGSKDGRPVGVTVIALVLLLGSLALLGLGLVGLLSRPGIGILLLVVGGLNLALAVGLLRTRQWAYYGTIVLQAITIPIAVLQGNPIGIAVSVVIIAYLKYVSDYFA